MSLRTIIRKANARGDIRYLSTTTGSGGQLTKTWKMRHRNVSGRLESLTTKKEILYFDQDKTFAEFVWLMEYREGITTKDRLCVKTRTFNIKHIQNWDEQGKMTALALQEI